MKLDIVFCHLYNDYSGSPAILRNVIDVASRDEKVIKLYIGSSGRGVLEQCMAPIERYFYRRSGFKILTLLNYIISQFHLFFRLKSDRQIKKDTLIYVNTLLPFGAGLFGFLFGNKVVYHLHETSVSPKILHKFLCLIVKLTSNINIYVSKSHSIQLPIKGVPAITILNSLSEEFLLKSAGFLYRFRRCGSYKILMISSLRDYKGVPEFIKIAKSFEFRSDIIFNLVLNDDDSNINGYFERKALPHNLIMYGRTSEPESFYKEADLLLNLTRVDLCIETFGMTILEAMSFGVPVIAPPVGGPSELISNGIEGFLVDSRNHTELISRISLIADNPDICNVMSCAARLRSEAFSVKAFADSVRNVLISFEN